MADTTTKQRTQHHEDCLVRGRRLVAMNSKGQVTVPRENRDRLGLKSGDEMAFNMLSDGTVVMRAKTGRLVDLARSLTRPGQPKVSIEEMDPSSNEHRHRHQRARAPVPQGSWAWPALKQPSATAAAAT
jgi:antitoxin PrlF